MSLVERLSGAISRIVVLGIGLSGLLTLPGLLAIQRVLGEDPSPRAVLYDGVLFLAIYSPVALAAALVVRRRVSAAVERALLPLRSASDGAEGLAEQTLGGLSQGGLLPGAGEDDEVGRFVSVVNKLLTDIRRRRARERRFTANAAHELRTPLAALQTQVQVTLRRPRSAERYRATIAEIGEQLDELVRIAQTLLELSRVGDAALILHPPAPARQVLQAICDQAVVARGGGMVRVHPLLFRAAIENLITNAERYAGGVLTLSVEGRGGGVAFVVEDGGPGIPDADRAFEAFERLGRSSQGGSGLGLTLVREIAQAHGGDAFIEPRPGGGTRAGIWLPRAEPQGA